MGKDIVNSMSVLAGLGVTISAEAQGWPYVTLNDFHERASNAEFLSRTTLLSINQIVQATR